MYYRNRTDNLYQRKKFPFEFRQLDYYNFNQQLTSTNKNWPHWKDIETTQYVKRRIRFYPLRFHDGLIEREELFGEKTVEKYQNRDDRLIYQAVRFQENSKPNGTYSFAENNVGLVAINKMVQKYEKNNM